MKLNKVCPQFFCCLYPEILTKNEEGLLLHTQETSFFWVFLAVTLEGKARRKTTAQLFKCH